MKHRFCSSRFGALLVPLMLLLGGARAQAAEDPEALVEKGLELRRQHKNAEALEAFREAWAIAPSPRIRAQIALAEQALGDWSSAEGDLAAALAATDDAWIEKHRAILEEARSKVAGHLGWIELVVDVDGVDAFLDGVLLGPTPRSAPIRVVAGSHRLEIRSKGMEPVSREVVVAPLAKTRVVMSAPQPAPLRRERRVEASSGYGVPVLLLGGSAVALGFGTWLGLRTFATKSERDAHCHPITCDEEGIRLDQSARTSATWSTVSFVTGAALGTVGTVLLLRSRSTQVSVTARPTSVALTVGGFW
jgi:hypothetical protein